MTAVLDEWWGGRRRMVDMLPRLFFAHFRDTSFVAERDGELAGFLVGFLSQSDAEAAYVHFVGVSPDERGSGLGRELYERFFEVARGHGRRTVSCVTTASRKGGGTPPATRSRSGSGSYRFAGSPSRLEVVRQELSLAELRRARSFTQKQLATALETTQPGVSRIEHQTDLYVSTLRSYVEALGGNLEVRAVFHEAEVVINSVEGLNVEAAEDDLPDPTASVPEADRPVAA